MLPTGIAAAAAQGANEVVAGWLDLHPERVNDVTNQGASLLLLCLDNDVIRDTHPELVRNLLSRGADPNHMCHIADDGVEGCMTPLFWICVNQSPHAPHIVTCLLNAGADPNLRLANPGDPDLPPDLPNSTPLLGAIRTFLGAEDGTWQLSVVARLLKAGASLDNSQGRSADEWIAEEERRWPALAANNVHFRAAATLIRAVRAAGSWKKYCRRRAPHREILGLRSLAMRGYITPYQRRRTRGAEYKIAIAFVARLGDNGVVWNILSFWRDPDDIDYITLDDGDVVSLLEE